jgi:hypothetical protein
MKHITKAKVILNKHAPEILLVSGTIVVISSAVYACRQTLKAHDILEEANSDLADVEKAITVSNSDDYTPKDARSDRRKVYGRTFFDLAKCYGPAVIGAIIGFGMIFGGHKILRGRNIALTAAYSTLLAQFKDYRAKVVEKLGEDEEFRLRSGMEERAASIIDEDGNEVEAAVNYIPDNGEGHSIYARIFDETCSNWSRNPVANLTFLRGQQHFANEKLRAEGILFLNDVYESLGLPRTSEGQIVGWVWDPNKEIDDHAGDNYVDFGIYNELYKDAARRDFINAAEPCVWLDFNVDGVIYDLM